jgi:hypothetical protein
MADRAQIRSVDALEAFRLRLIQYVEKATHVIDEVGSDMKRTRAWLEDHQKPYWEHQVRVRHRALEEAQHAAFSAKLSQLRASSDIQQVTVQRARKAFREAEEKLRCVKVWCRRYQSEVEPHGRDVERLRTVLEQDLQKGAAHLDRLGAVLSEYLSPRQTQFSVHEENRPESEAPMVESPGKHALEKDIKQKGNG